VLLAKVFGIWLLILVCAVLNGVLREAVLLPAFGKPVALVSSGVVLSLLIVAVSLVLVPRLGPLSVSHAMYLGVFWLLLTLAFEFGFGLLVQHRSWAELMEAYTFKDGNIWPLVLAVTLFSPAIAVRRRPRTGSETGRD
jgi:hypothetical protein